MTPAREARGPSFLRQARDYTAGLFLTRPLGIATAVGMRRLLDPEQMGFWSGVVRVLFDWTRITGLGVSTAALLEIPYFRGAGDEDRAMAIRRTAFSLNAVTVTLYACAIAAAAWVLRERLGLERTATLACAAALVVLLKYCNLYRDILRADGKFDVLAREMVLDAVVQLALMVLLVPRWGLLGLVAATGGAMAADLAWMSWKGGGPYCWDLRWEVLRPLVAYGAPLLLLSFLTTWLRSVDRIMVTGMIGQEAMGHYSVGLLAYGLLYDLANSVGIVLLTRLLEGWGRDRDLVRLRAGAMKPLCLLSLALPVLFGFGALLSPRAVAILMPEYVEGVGAARILLAAACFSAVHVPSRHVISTLRHQVRAAPLVAVTIGLSVLLNWVLLRAGWGIAGAAIAALAAYGLGALAHLLYALRITGGMREAPVLLGWSLLPLAYAAAGVWAAERLWPGDAWAPLAVRTAAFLAWSAPLLWAANRLYPLRRLVSRER